jgi:hypothetical protein
MIFCEGQTGCRVLSRAFIEGRTKKSQAQNRIRYASEIRSLEKRF